MRDRTEYHKEYRRRPEVRERNRNYLREYRRKPGIAEKYLEYERARKRKHFESNPELKIKYAQYLREYRAKGKEELTRSFILLGMKSLYRVYKHDFAKSVPEDAITLRRRMISLKRGDPDKHICIYDDKSFQIIDELLVQSSFNPTIFSAFTKLVDTFIKTRIIMRSDKLIVLDRNLPQETFTLPHVVPNTPEEMCDNLYAVMYHLVAGNISPSVANQYNRMANTILNVKKEQRMLGNALVRAHKVKNEQDKLALKKGKKNG